MKTIAEILKEHSFFQGLSEEDSIFIAGCGKIVHFKQGDTIASTGDKADLFFLLRQGSVKLQIDNPPKTSLTYQTLKENEILGLCWLIPPYLWTETAKASTDVKAIALDGACLRKKCENDPRLGYLLMKRLVSVLVQREDAFRLHLLDIYANAR